MRIEWVHPTWRDLVIAMLIDEDQARGHFLRRCGVHGVELALSTAGGAAGKRRLPLIRSDADWDALADRLYELVAELEGQDLIAVLAALAAAIDDLPGEPEATALARTVLARATSLWNAAGRPIAVDLLDAWLSLAGRVAPRPAPPELALTWAALVPAEIPKRDDRAALERFADWLVLCELVRGYDGWLLDQLGFGVQIGPADGRAPAAAQCGRARGGAAAQPARADERVRRPWATRHRPCAGRSLAV